MSSSNTTCYDPNGNVLTGNYPCSFPHLSTCCGYGWDCLDNGLCRQHGTTGYAQSQCTNPSYENCLAFCNQSQFDGFGEVSRCGSNDNSWCCAGAAGQGLGGTDCCDTNRTTSLEPYPFSAIDNTGQSVVISSSVSSSITLTSLISSGATLTSALSHSLSLGTSLQSTSQTPITPAITSTQILATSHQTSVTALSPQPTGQSHGSRTGIEVGIPVAIVVVLLAVLAFFMFQNRKFKRRLLQLNGAIGEDTRPDMQQREGVPMGELDITHYELTQRNAPKHELLGNEIHEMYHNGILEHELVGDQPRR